MPNTGTATATAEVGAELSPAPASAGRLSEARVTPLDLAAFLPYACHQLQLSFHVHVVLQTQEEYVSRTEEKSKKLKAARSTILAPAIEAGAADDASSVGMHSELGDDEVITLVTVCDPAGHVVELIFNRCGRLPRLLLKLICLCLPFHPLLARLTVRWTPLQGEILHEVATCLTLGTLTDLCLDDSPVCARNYHELLERPSSLRALSLQRCGIDDRDCTALAARLAHPQPAARTLGSLSLAGNRIGDAGAAALGRALRSNRTLRHLNLAGNRITDEGAARILDSLVEFPLTLEEMEAKRRRRFEHLQRRSEAYARCLAELRAAHTERAVEESARSSRKRGGGGRARRLSASSSPDAGSEALAHRAHNMVDELLGAFSEPFGAQDTVVRGGRVHSTGNAVLCYLNVAYNDVGYATAVRLVRVLSYQSAQLRRLSAVAGGGGAGGGGGEAGLLRAVLEGTAVPRCRELVAVAELEERAVLARAGKLSGKRTDRTKSRVFKSFAV